MVDKKIVYLRVLIIWCGKSETFITSTILTIKHDFTVGVPMVDYHCVSYSQTDNSIKL